ncbi:hypothetical protein FLONG3_2810 [Fusarium longipes]|uniref:Heterokaryon incompatibility domain-containing protein n=1 Tax=Fusarium longipes TaxID=694270 RepID=A0A395T3V2_9HYPO|nr:hypothetical protein FLONG3_2810 [Fusarium longipes]
MPIPPRPATHYGFMCQSLPGVITSFGMIDSYLHPLTPKTPLFTASQQNSIIKRLPVSNRDRSKPEIRQFITNDDASSLQDPTVGIYNRLVGSDKFRLLEILPGIFDTIEAKLHVCNLKENVMAYEALSYTWGNDVASHHPVISIEANGGHHMTTVSRNLHTALLGLRQRDSSRLVWADAICINQEDTVEKGEQVKMMKTIYSDACRVIIWLGDDSNSQSNNQALLGDSPIGSTAFSSVCSTVNDWLTRNGINEIEAAYNELLDNGNSIIHHDTSRHRIHPHSGEYRNEYYRRRFDMLTLYQRTWFTRVWVIQEGVLARSAVVQLGPYQIDWEWIGLAAAIMLHNPVMNIYGHGQETIPRGVTNAYMMYRLSTSQSCLSPLKFTFAQLLRVTRSFDCKEDRDRIYGLIGIQTTDGLNRRIIPDYSDGTTIDKVYLDIAWLLLKSESPLTLLSSATFSPSEDHCQPGSWIPKWGQHQPWTILPIHPHPQFRCALDQPTRVIGNEHSTNLTVEGVIVNQIKKVWDTNVPEQWHYMPEHKAFKFLKRPRWSDEDWQKCALSLSCGGDGRGYPVNSPSTHLADLAAAILSDNKTWLIYNLLAFETVVKSRPDDDMTQEEFLTNLAKDGDHRRFLASLSPLRRNYKAFVTEPDFFGIGPAPMMEGDLLCVLFGAAVPFVLRPVQGGYQLVGECYVFDLMHEQSLDLTRALGHIPRLPNKIPRSLRWLEGFSTWGDFDCCCPVKIKREHKQTISLTKFHPTNCSISTSSNFRIWEADANNGIALLTLGWAYIFSASLAERQGLSMRYGPLLASPTSSIVLDLSYASPKERRWWKSIITPGTGWFITGSVLTPWAVAIDDLDIMIRDNGEQCQQPPTSQEAACYLSRVCTAYKLGSQCSAALAAAIAIPLQANATPLETAVIELPKPSFNVHYRHPEPVRSVVAEFHRIGYYMTLSLCPWVLGPSLWSVFWSPHVPCNHAGAWLAPIIEILEPIIQNDDMELLAKIFAFSPFSSLWLGLALCGRGEVITSILPSLKHLRDYTFFRPDVDAAAWTGVAQSFLDLGLSGLATDSNVPRADVWRMRHDFAHLYQDETFSYTPPHGWPPFGIMRAEDVEIEVRGHLPCSHRWRYMHWTWSFNGSTDVGFSSRSMRIQHSGRESTDTGEESNLYINNRDLIGSISQAATETVLSWGSDEVERGLRASIVTRYYEPNESVEDKTYHGQKGSSLSRKWLKSINQ